jgi:hypothetical protein
MTPSLAASLLCGIAVAVFAIYQGADLAGAATTGAIAAIIVQVTVAKRLAAMLRPIVNFAGWIVLFGIVALFTGLI